MPFFDEQNEAERYARYRPYFHPLVIARAKETAGLSGKLPLALDVASGTGQSAVALTSIAERVIGLDISRSMLASAEQNERVRYVRARAEALPFQSGRVPIISAALAFHWFDRQRFLQDAWRVLSDNGLLLIYNNGFTGIMKEDQAFQNWSRQKYPGRFPTPPRDSRALTPEEAENSGFSFIKEERFENDVCFTAEELAAYLTTQTNVVSAVEAGRESLESASQWLIRQVQPFFADSTATFVFATRAWYLRKAAVH